MQRVICIILLSYNTPPQLNNAEYDEDRLLVMLVDSLDSCKYDDVAGDSMYIAEVACGRREGKSLGFSSKEVHYCIG